MLCAEWLKNNKHSFPTVLEAGRWKWSVDSVSGPSLVGSKGLLLIGGAFCALLQGRVASFLSSLL